MLLKRRTPGVQNLFLGNSMADIQDADILESLENEILPLKGASSCVLKTMNK